MGVDLRKQIMLLTKKISVCRVFLLKIFEWFSVKGHRGKLRTELVSEARGNTDDIEVYILRGSYGSISLV